MTGDSQVTLSIGIYLVVPLLLNGTASRMISWRCTVWHSISDDVTLNKRIFSKNMHRDSWYRDRPPTGIDEVIPSPSRSWRSASRNPSSDIKRASGSFELPDLQWTRYASRFHSVKFRDRQRTLLRILDDELLSRLPAAFLSRIRMRIPSRTII
jgi:hypothetical protein